MADTSSINAIDMLLARIADMQSLKPQRVIPAHYVKEDTSPAVLDFVKRYLTDYKNAAMTHKDAAGIVAAMEAKYPALPGRESLEFGAKVFTGEASWQVTSPYPPICKTAEVKFDDIVFDLHFTDNRTLSFEGIAGPVKGIKDTVQYTVIEVARNVFMVYWQEPNAGLRVVHVQDWNTGTVYTNVAEQDNAFTHLKGTIKIK